MYMLSSDFGIWLEPKHTFELIMTSFDMKLICSHDLMISYSFFLFQNRRTDFLWKSVVPFICVSSSLKYFRQNSRLIFLQNSKYNFQLSYVIVYMS